jgi:hypothetical protein
MAFYHYLHSKLKEISSSYDTHWTWGCETDYWKSLENKWGKDSKENRHTYTHAHTHTDTHTVKGRKGGTN